MKKAIAVFALCMGCTITFSQDKMNKKIENTSDKMNKKMDNSADKMPKKKDGKPDSTTAKIRKVHATKKK